jgi:hypothetical protein
MVLQTPDTGAALGFILFIYLFESSYAKDCDR